MKNVKRYHHGALREAALESTAHEVDRVGHQLFTLERVAGALRVTPAALYRHFQNREDLLNQFVWSRFVRFAEAADAAALAATKPRDVILGVALAYLKFALANPGWFRLQFSAEGIRRYSARQQQAEPAYYGALLKALTALTGTTGAERDRHYFAMFALMHGLTALCVEGVTPFNTEAEKLAAATEAVVRFVEGLKKQRGSRQRAKGGAAKERRAPR